MEVIEEIKEAKDLLQCIIKAKKTLRMYPHNNPVYVKMLDESYLKFKNFLDYKETFALKIRQNSILYDAEQIYSSAEKEDNLALFFFKDGLRELTFKKGLSHEELEEFLKITALDFEREVMDEDIVTLLWEKDFQNIHYIVDEAFLIDSEEEEYEAVAEKNIKEQVTDVNDLMRAYADGFQEEEFKGIAIVPLTDKDLQTLVKELEKDTSDKIEKLVAILFEIVYQTEDKSDTEDVFTFLKYVIQYCMKYGHVHMALNIMKEAREVIDDPDISENDKKYMRMLSLYLGNEEIVALLAEFLDSGIELDEGVFENLVVYFEKNAIEPFVKYLGEMKTIRARKNVIDALISLGKKDIQMLARKLDDQRWYVVRNIIYILRKIGDRRAIDYLLKTVRHGDIRVRKEVIKALGELGGREVVQTLRECLDNPDVQVRTAAVKAFGNIGSEPAKKIVLDKISDRSFKDKGLEEKKEFFETIARWKDTEVFDFLVKVMKLKSFFNRSKIIENKACAAHGLGLLGNKDALPLLEKFKDSNNKLLKDFANSAIRKLTYDQ
ncbi:MAG: HEAT repeat domain-containing protein [Thermodesulfovibrionales bacterium]|jgi:HEAT repeat protein